MPSEILVDHTGLIASASYDDRLYFSARKKWDSLLKDGSLLVIPKTVLVQALSAVQKSAASPSDGRALAVVIGDQLHYFDQSGQAKLINITEAQERDGWEIFRKREIEEMTLSDCLCVAIALRRKIASVFSSKAFYRYFKIDPLLG